MTSADSYIKCVIDVCVCVLALEVRLLDWLHVWGQKKGSLSNLMESPLLHHCLIWQDKRIHVDGDEAQPDRRLLCHICVFMYHVFFPFHSLWRWYIHPGMYCLTLQNGCV